MDRYEFEQFFDCSTGKHPPLLKEFLSGNFSIENVIIYEKIFEHAKNFDKTPSTQCGRRFIEKLGIMNHS